MSDTIWLEERVDDVVAVRPPLLGVLWIDGVSDFRGREL